MARVERERLFNRVIVYIAIAIVVIVVLLVGGGAVLENLIWPSQPVAVVNGEEITTREYQARARFERIALINSYAQTAQNLQFFGNNPEIQTQIANQLQQIIFQLDPVSVGSNTINTMIDETLIRQEAEERGISVSVQEVDEFIQELFGFYPDGRPTPTSSPTLAPTSTLSATQLALVSPTPIVTETPTITATLESTPTTEATPTAEPTITPTPTAYTLEAYRNDFQEYLNGLNEEVGFTEQDYRELIQAELYRQKLMEVITADIVPQREQVWARHILVEDEETAQEVLQKLESGEDWTDLAAEYSADTSNSERGGDLGWFEAQDMVAEFSEAAFALDIGEISEPVESSFGWHIIQVLGHEVRPLSQQQLNQRKQQQFQVWLENARAEADWELMDYWDERAPTKPDLPAYLPRPEQLLQQQP